VRRFALITILARRDFEGEDGPAAAFLRATAIGFVGEEESQGGQDECPERTPVPGEPGEFTVHVDLTVIGGAGKFAEATGTMTFDGTSHTLAVPATVDLIYKGTVCGPNIKGDGN
jgi:hypothetical protein